MSDLVAATLRAMIVDGRLDAGERLNEVHLATYLGVSRTPLREALSRLAAEGALTSMPRIDFFVSPLTLAEFEQIYPIRAILDPEALRMAGIPPRAQLSQLRSLNQRIRQAGDADKAIALDNQWHRELLSGCRNRVLLGLIEQFMQRTHRYELALWREERNVRHSTEGHDQILAALRADDMDRACQALRQNLQSGIQPILAWLKRRQRTHRRPGPQS